MVFCSKTQPTKPWHCASEGSHQPWHCSDGLTGRISDNFLGVGSRCLRWMVTEITLRKRRKEGARSFSGFSMIWCVVLFAGLVTHKKQLLGQRTVIPYWKLLLFSGSYSFLALQLWSNEIKLGVMWTQPGWQKCKVAQHMYASKALMWLSARLLNILLWSCY